MHKNFKYVIAEVLVHYDLGTLVSFELMTGGYANTNVKLQTSKGVYFFRAYNNRANKSNLTKINNYLIEAKAKGQKVAAPFRTKDGHTFVMQQRGLTHNYFAIFEFIPGQTINSEKYLNAKSDEERALWGLTPQRERNAAIELAKLHNSVQSVPKRDVVVKDCFQDRGVLELKNYLDQLHPSTPFERTIFKYKESLLEMISIYYSYLKKVPKSEPDSIIHTDFWEGQVIFDGPQVAALVDFDALVFGRAGYDVLKGAWSFSKTYDPHGDIVSLEKLEKFLDAYVQVADRPLNVVAPEVIAFVLHGKLESLSYLLKIGGNYPLQEIAGSIEHQLKLLKWVVAHKDKIAHLFLEADKKCKKR